MKTQKIFYILVNCDILYLGDVDMLDFTFLTEEQCFGDKQLDILKTLNQDMDAALTSHLEDNKVHLKGLL